MIWVELTGPEPFPPIIRQALVFLDVLFMILFAVLYALGLTFRRTPGLHARLMGSTIQIGLGPALVRLYAHYIPQAGGLSGSIRLMFCTIEAILLIASLPLVGVALFGPFPRCWRHSSLFRQACLGDGPDFREPA